MSAEDTEWFEYPTGWADAYREERGSLHYFPQYALMELLRQRHGIHALTWLHLASIDRRARRRMAANEEWAPASPRPSRKPRHTRRRQAAWQTLRQQMGETAFDTLQEAIVRAEFKGAYQGEPDLFCWSSSGWFFAEAKRPGERVLASQRRWWDVAERCLGKDCRIFTFRLVPEGELPADRSAHSARWKKAIRGREAHSGPLGSGKDFVNRVLRRRRKA